METTQYIRITLLTIYFCVLAFISYSQVDVLGARVHQYPANEAYADKRKHSVYTVAQVDSRINNLNSKIDNVNSNLNSLISSEAAVNLRIEQTIEKTEARFNNLVKESIDKLPQRLLSEEAKNALKEAVLADIRIELATLRKDMQSQIDDLKSQK